jgi:hypothetical protein
MGIWKEWKNCKTRIKNLRKLVIEKQILTNGATQVEVIAEWHTAPSCAEH